MMSSKVTLLGVPTRPMVLQTALARSTSQPLISPVCGSMYSLGAYVASTANCTVVPLTELGTSLTMFAWAETDTEADVDAGGELPPQAASTSAGNASAIPARRPERLTVRTMFSALF